jgi:hypothetical protein
MREFHIVCPQSLLESIPGDPNLFVLCHYIYMYENSRVVLQVPIFKNQSLNVRIYDLYENIRPEDKLASQKFRANIIRGISADSPISYCIVSIVYTKPDLRIGRHYSQTHNIDHIKRFTDECPVKKHKDSYNVNRYKWNMDRLFFLRLNVTAGQTMEAHVAKFLHAVRTTNIRTPCDLLSQLIRYGNEHVYFYKPDIDITNGVDNDFCDTAIEDTGCGDCEDSSHFIVRFVHTLSVVGEVLAKLIITDQKNYNSLCSVIKQLAQCEPRLLLCFNKNNEFHCINVFVAGNQHYYADSTSVDTAFDGDENYEKKYGEKCFLISRMHIGNLDGNFFNLEREF